jgi:hypothetical protein
LEAFDLPTRSTLWQFLVQDATPTRHPLHIPGSNDADISQAVTVTDITIQHVSDGLNATVGMRGKTCNRTLDWVIEREMIKEQKWVKWVCPAGTKGTAKQDIGSLDHEIRLNNLFNFPGGFGHTAHSFYLGLEPVINNLGSRIKDKTLCLLMSYTI